MNEQELKTEMTKLLNWYCSLQPSDKVSVWSKDGQYNGLFTMDNEQLVQKYLDKISLNPIKA